MDLYRAVLNHKLEQLRAVIDDHVLRFSDAPEEVWRSAIYSIVDLQFPAVGQEIIPELAPHMGEELPSNLDDLLSVYHPLLQRAAQYKLCPADLKPLEFHYAIVALSRPLPEPAEHILSKQRKWLVDLFLDALQGRAQKG